MDVLPVAAYAIAALIPIVLACALTVWLVRSLGGGGKKKRARQLPSPSLPVAQARSSARQAQPPAASGAKSTSPAGSTGDRELLSVVRTKEGGLSVLAGGRPYRRLRDINDPRVGQDTIEAIRAVLAFAEGWLSFIQEWSAEISKAEASPPARPGPAQQSRPESTGRAPLPHTGTMAVPPPGSMLAPLPLIDEVNDLVQKRLRENPDLADHLITLSTALDGSLRIYVNQQVFQAVGDITDPQVKALIQGAIREWEAGYH
jgi:hypothetical protein